MYAFNNKLNMCLHEIHSLRALLSIYVQLFEELIFLFWMFHRHLRFSKQKTELIIFPLYFVQFHLLA